QRTVARSNQTSNSDFGDMPILFDQDRRPCIARDMDRNETQRSESRRVDRDIRMQPLIIDTDLNNSMCYASPPLVDDHNATTLQQNGFVTSITYSRAPQGHTRSRPLDSSTSVTWSLNKQNIADRQRNSYGPIAECRDNFDRDF